MTVIYSDMRKYLNDIYLVYLSFFLFYLFVCLFVRSFVRSISLCVIFGCWDLDSRFLSEKRDSVPSEISKI